ncbi:MAG: BMP family ABC transporter substrate-binding protein, partial [Lachnospiraceae bacterium]|nr:BMP family ABC transporter substrate-binding protein [Lachnospiraceae bacterium]
ILEGNKRVSVLKYFGAPTIPGTVIRLVPERTNAPENRLYYEYLAFYKQCPANYLVFSKLGSYAEFLDAAGKKASERWTPEEMRDLHASFARFQQAFSNYPGKENEHIQVADAYLTYVKIYGYRESLDKVPDVIRDELGKIRDEITLLRSDDTVAYVLEADEAPKKSLFERLFVSDRKLKVAFLYNRKPEDSSWTYGHELGRLALDEACSNELVTVKYENVDPETEADEVLEQAIQDGADVIFATTRLFMKSCLRAAIRHPKVKILACTLNAAHRYIRSYYARIYEAKYLSGIIAGILAENGKIGYLSNYPIPMNFANINAFSLGVKAVNPSAKVHLKWTSEAGTDAAAYFRENDIRIISGRELVMPSSISREFGLYRVEEDGSFTNLAMPIINWGILYQKLIASIRDGNFEDVDKRSGQRALNYWWGMESEVIDLVISRHVPEETVKFITFLQERIRDSSLQPFKGRILSQNRVISEDENHVLTPEEIMAMDWLSDNVIGRIPPIEALDPEGKATVAAMEQDREIEGISGEKA